jgi:hypothetical protein
MADDLNDLFLVGLVIYKKTIPHAKILPSMYAKYARCFLSLLVSCFGGTTGA